jgi:hypothetical protein
MMRLPRTCNIGQPVRQGRWVPAIGGAIPLTDLAKKFVAFVVGWRKTPDGVHFLTPIGTTFFTAVPLQTVPGSFFTYLVTAKHVVENEREVFIRAKVASGASELFKADGWTYHPTEDVAVLGLTGDVTSLDYARMDITDMFLDHHPDLTASLGDRVYFIGLLADLPGMADRDVPMVRSGTVGALWEERVPIRLPDRTRRFITAHLVDCRSFSGFSGSPCFAQFNDPLGEVTPLLGLMSGHFDKWAETRPAMRDDNGEQGDHAADYVGDLEAPVNSGIGLCTPVEKITETLHLEELVEARQQSERVVREERERDAGAIADTVADQRSEFRQFEELTRRLVNVPKKEIDEKRRDES